ncbi:MAG: zinc-binding alcohol dehydrogenase, partial [SAR324 cluster bacterium]|nr:zinc-binding alcohol dehydrogenase [SAR324 cluster bacterium]
MKQVVQSYKTGEVTLREMPVPQCGSKRILVKNRHSLVSLGTERMTIELGRKSLLGKAKARPDLVRRVWEKAKQEGLLKTYQEAMGRLDAPTPLGYSCSGVVIESGVSASAFTPGDRVACVGQGFASHADFVSVPPNLACRIPEQVSDEAATFGMLGIIALHGIRRAELSFGSHVTVLGLGLLGLLSVQILQAYGCQVTAMDLDARKVNLAQQLGVSFATIDGDGLQQQVHAVTYGHGADAVLITAASKSREPVDLAIRLSRSRAKIVVVGTADIHPDRNELWQKEVELLVSRAAGPGSLDPLYELEGGDLPIGEVRWTENRNLQEFLRLVSEERVQLDPLITHRISFSKAEQT